MPSVPLLMSSLLLLALLSPAARGFSPRPLLRRSFQTGSFSLGAKAVTSPDDGALDGYSARKVFMFPGQGAQFVGMAEDTAKSSPAAAALFSEASSILGYDLLSRCVSGPKELLDTTACSQPAIFVASMAALAKFEEEGGDVSSATAACGLSLGEYTALCFAGAISFADGVRITQARGEAMQAASDEAESGMASVIGLDKGKVGELCERASEVSGEQVAIANFLCAGNYAVSGSKKAIATVREIAKPEFKARMAVPLAVAGAFHTSFMEPAVAPLKAVLETVEVKRPRIAVVSNVDAMPHSDPAVIKQILARQVTSPVQWEATMETLLEGGFEEGYEFGPGKVVSGIMKRVDKTAKMTNVEV
ncbi:hypothetical protein TeGR_g3954 [Tetraparma gracilis]|uniref:Malonyl-CoA:ACP transacylase (MAT) domain-containing protein n=1 Tax=Tetraparma gracilis TaxID=2962635 RepID=A0ABQ6N107_9STRA|nr:hypothetical protein TeGR_g3954 [Tetraparma gracilis]